MATGQPGIGGNIQPTETAIAIADIPSTRTLMAIKLTPDTPLKPEIKEGLTDISQVFEYYKPSIEMEFESEQGTMRKETLRFNGLSNFGVKGITSQSSFLNELNMKKEQYQKIIRQLKTNKLLQQVLTDKNSKQHLIQALHVLIQKLEEAK